MVYFYQGERVEVVGVRARLMVRVHDGEQAGYFDSSVSYPSAFVFPPLPFCLRLRDGKSGGARKGPRKCYDNLRYIFKRMKERKEKKAKWRTS